MNSIFRKFLPSHFLIVLISSTFFYFYQLLNSWPILRSWGMSNGYNFGDLSLVINRIGCQLDLIATENDNPICYISETDGKEYTSFPYGIALHALLKLLGINKIDTLIVGYLLIILLTICFAMLSKYFSQFNNIYAFMAISVLYSPPIQLLVERMNIDIIIFLLICLASYMFSRNHFLLGLTIILITTLSKYYTLSVLFIFYFLVKKSIHKVFVLVSLLFCFVVLFFDTSVVQGSRIGAFAAFGAPVYGSYLNEAMMLLNFHLELSYIGQLLFGLFALIFILFCLTTNFNFARYIRNVIKDNVQIDVNDTSKFKFVDWFYLINSLVFISCFILGNNFDYRLIFLAASIFSLLGIRYLNVHKFIILIMFFIFWCSFNIYFLQPVGDVLLIILVSLMIIDIYYNYKFIFSNYNFIRFILRMKDCIFGKKVTEK